MLNRLRKRYALLRQTLAVHRAISKDMRSARRVFLSSGALSKRDRALLKRVSLRVDPQDGMYQDWGGTYYLSAGLTGVRCVERAVETALGGKAVRSILDFPSGYGRVLRFLRVAFPKAKILASDIHAEALAFCRRVFGVDTALSNEDFSRMELGRTFDLIWCGSLITHIDEAASLALLQFFHRHLSGGGLCLFSAHGRDTVRRLAENVFSYGLSEPAQQEVLCGYRDAGYGFADYHDRRGYGISAVTRERMLAIAQSAGPWEAALYEEQGWDASQDLYGFIKKG